MPAVYSKAGIAESTFPDRFYLLRENELGAGIMKAQGLLDRLALPGNRLVALADGRAETRVEREHTHWHWALCERGSIVLDGIAWVDITGERLVPVVLEEACALSLRLLHRELHSFESLRPRSFSILPIAKGCQASCPFCFSDASASAEQDQARLNLQHLHEYAQLARSRGAERFVITGGGEPGLVRHELLCEVIATGSVAIGENGAHQQRPPSGPAG
jgi:hypothetical protein